MLDEINTIYPGSTYEKIEYIRGVNFAVRQALSSNFGVLVGVGYLLGGTNTQKITLRTVFDPQGYEVDHDYRLSTIPISIGPEIWYENGKFIFRAGVAAVLHFIEFEERFGENQYAGYSGEQSLGVVPLWGRTLRCLLNGIRCRNISWEVGSDTESREFRN
jgi:hypothetical protein